MKWVENGDSTIQFYCDKEKKNIFLIGDSIRKGYCATVEEDLREKANVFFVTENCRSSQFIIFSMRKWAGYFNDPALVDVVHFNCGQWDVAHFNGHALPLTSEGEYERNLQIIVDELKVFFPNAKLVFATTSPMNPDGSNGRNPRTNEAVDRYNEIARVVMEKNDIPIHDVNGFMRDWESEKYSDSCHLTPEGFALLGHRVAEELEKYI